jgi:electron transfer flavoprotein beta subunit
MEKAQGSVRILVLVKQVPSPEDPGAWEMNRFDEYAVEEALGIRDRFPGSGVHVMTLGPERALRVIRRALGMGADQGIHVRTPDRETAGSLLTAARASAALEGRDYDLVFTGMFSQDGMEGQVGPLLAELSGMPCAVGVVETALEQGGQRVRVLREMEAGRRETLSIALPAVLAVQAGINRPRYPSLSNVLAASRKPVLTLDGKDLPVGPFGEGIRTLALVPPAKTREGRFLKGNCREKASELFHVLRKRGLL